MCDENCLKYTMRSLNCEYKKKFLIKKSNTRGVKWSVNCKKLFKIKLYPFVNLVITYFSSPLLNLIKYTYVYTPVSGTFQICTPFIYVSFITFTDTVLFMYSASHDILAGPNLPLVPQLVNSYTEIKKIIIYILL